MTGESRETLTPTRYPTRPIWRHVKLLPWFFFGIHLPVLPGLFLWSLLGHPVRPSGWVTATTEVLLLLFCIWVLWGTVQQEHQLNCHRWYLFHPQAFRWKHER